MIVASFARILVLVAFALLLLMMLNSRTRQFAGTLLLLGLIAGSAFWLVSRDHESVEKIVTRDPVGQQREGQSAGRDGLYIETAADELDASENSEDGPESMPQWIERGSFVLGNGDEYMLVESDRHFDAVAAREQLDQLMQSMVRKKIDSWIQPGAGNLIGIDSAYIRRHMLVPGHETHRTVKFEFGGSVEAKYGDMVVAYSQIKLDEAFRNHVVEEWKDHETRSRLLQTGLVGGGAFTLLLLAFGYFRADHATRGFYTGRLQILALAMMLFLIAGGVLLANKFIWI